jgi:ATP-binding cassette, subfamily B, multidrug efflux pump
VTRATDTAAHRKLTAKDLAGPDEHPADPNQTATAKQKRAGEKKLDRNLMRGLWEAIRPHKLGLIAAILMVPIVDGAHLAQPYLLKVAVDQNFAQRDSTGLLRTGLMFFGLLAVEFVLGYVQLYLMNVTGQRAMRDLRVRTFAHMQSLDPQFFTKQPVGKLLTRLTSDVEAIQEAIAGGVVSLISDVFKLVGIVTIMLILDPKLTFVAMISVPVLALAAVAMRKVLRAVYREVRTQLAIINSFLNESLNGIALVQGYAREARTAAEYDDLNAEFRDSYQKAIRFDATLFAVVEMAATVTIGAILWSGGLRIFEGALTFGTLIAFMEWMRRFFVPLRDISMKYSMLQSALAAAEKIFWLLGQKATLREGEVQLVGKRPTFNESIALDHVRFAYPGGEDVLPDFSLTIRKGERVALVGATGSGKTTVSRLLNRFVDPVGGAVRLDGRDIRDLDIDCYRSLFAVVPQEVFLFAGTLRDNIRLGKDGQGLAGDAEIERAVNSVAGMGLLKRLPDGLDHKLTERGANLSAGEAQLVAFARALVAKPEILILDEATSSVDPETEAALVAATQEALAGRTALIIAHRLSTVRNADRIVVMNRGRIVEQGRHDELLALDGLYARLCRLQFDSNAEVARDLEQAA